MAIRPGISLQARPADLSSIFTNALQTAQGVQAFRQRGVEAPFRNRILEAQASGAESTAAQAPLRGQLLEAQVGAAEADVTEQDQLNSLRSLAIFGGELSSDIATGNLESITAKVNQRISDIDAGRGDSTESRKLKANILDNPDLSREQKIAAMQNFAVKANQAAIQFGALKPAGGGFASAKTEILDDGTVIQALPGGEVQVRDPSGQIVTGQARLDALKKGREASPVNQQLELARVKQKNLVAEKETKKAAAAEAKKQQAGLVTFDISRALEQSQGAFTTGFTGSLASAVPGTDAFDLKNTLNTIKANIGFDKLQSMRENSPTGGALGQVSDNENRLLQSVLGSVEQSQSAEQLQFNLRRVQVIFDAIVNGSAAIPFTDAQFDALPVGTRYIDPNDGALHVKVPPLGEDNGE